MPFERRYNGSGMPDFWRETFTFQGVKVAHGQVVTLSDDDAAVVDRDFPGAFEAVDVKAETPKAETPEAETPKGKTKGG